jgi:hypothetical protein
MRVNDNALCYRVNLSFDRYARWNHPNRRQDDRLTFDFTRVFNVVPVVHNLILLPQELQENIVLSLRLSLAIQHSLS